MTGIAEVIERGLEWRSNNGAGPLTARVLCVSDGVVILERWKGKRKGNQNLRRFELPLKFFLSDKCGWKRDD